MPGRAACCAGDGRRLCPRPATVGWFLPGRSHPCYFLTAVDILELGAGGVIGLAGDGKLVIALEFLQRVIGEDVIGSIAERTPVIAQVDKPLLPAGVLIHGIERAESDADFIVE